MNRDLYTNIRQKGGGFTLVELLVVISIIALLLSILMPALNKVREQARIAVCGANCKQIAAVAAIYQVSNNGTVPPMLNGFAGGYPDVPIREVWLSVALKDYSGLKVKLPDTMNPDKNWGSLTIMNEYKRKYLPKFFVCPAGRGKAPDDGWFGPFNPMQIAGKTYYTRYALGAIDSYNTWLYPQKSGVVYDAGHPLGLPNGKRKYGSLNWYSRASALDKNGNVRPLNYPGKLTGAKWDNADIRDARAGSCSAAMVSYCGWGQWTGQYNDWTPRTFMNYGNHKKQGQGGTNAIFADGHTEWLPGMQIDDTGIN